MKSVAIKIEDELHKELKLYAVTQGKTITDIVVELIKNELETKKKEQTR